MKLFFSLVLALNITHASAYESILITYKKKDRTLKTIKKILTHDMHIPDVMFQYKQSDEPCKKIGSPIIQLCIKDKDFHVVQQKADILKKSVAKFLEGEE